MEYCLSELIDEYGAFEPMKPEPPCCLQTQSRLYTDERLDDEHIWEILMASPTADELRKNMAHNYIYAEEVSKMMIISSIAEHKNIGLGSFWFELVTLYRSDIIESICVNRNVQYLNFWRQYYRFDRVEVSSALLRYPESRWLWCGGFYISQDVLDALDLRALEVM
jgi:hypothetical protein